MTIFTARVHRDNWDRVRRASSCPSCSSPGFREEDFAAPQGPAAERARAGPARRTTRRSSARSGCRRSSSPARPTATRPSARSPGIESITLDDVKAFVARAYTPRSADRRPLRRRARRGSRRGSAASWRSCPRARPCAAPAGVVGQRAEGHRGRDRPEGDARHGDLVRPPDRGHPLAPGLRRRSTLARTWLGEHRSSIVAPLPAHPRGARDELRRLRLHRGLPARHVPVLPRPERRAAGAALRGLDPAGRAPRTARWRFGSRSTSCRKLDRERA